jgi:hypothetical protein
MNHASVFLIELTSYGGRREHLAQSGSYSFYLLSVIASLREAISLAISKQLMTYEIASFQDASQSLRSQ